MLNELSRQANLPARLVDCTHCYVHVRVFGVVVLNRDPFHGRTDLPLDSCH